MASTQSVEDDGDPRIQFRRRFKGERAEAETAHEVATEALELADAEIDMDRGERPRQARQKRIGRFEIEKGDASGRRDELVPKTGGDQGDLRGRDVRRRRFGAHGEMAAQRHTQAGDA